MSWYKPQFAAAMDLMLARLPERGPPTVVPTERALGRVTAQDIVVPHPFPVVTLARMDGHALGALDDSDGEAEVPDRVVRTGEAVPPWAVRVVPHEEFVPARDVAARGRGTFETHMVAAGGEYLAGELLVAAGTALREQHLAALRMLGVTHVAVRPLPEVRVIRFGVEPAGVATAGWVSGFCRAWGGLRVTQADAGDGASLSRSLGGDLSVVVSDSAPGRYDAIKALLLGGVDSLQPDFWKVDVHPCKHIGFSVFADLLPVLAMPDLFYKTVMSCTVFLGPVLEKLSGVARQATAARWEGDSSPPAHYPLVVPVEVRSGAWGAEALPLAGDAAPFSARHYLSAGGFCLLWRRVRRGDGVRVDPLLGSGAGLPAEYNPEE